MHTSSIHLILFFDSNHGKQNRKKVWNLQKAFSLCTIKICWFEIINGVKICLLHKTRLQISSEGTIRVCSRSLMLVSMCFLSYLRQNM